MAKQRVRIFVKGKVQGVFYRASTVEFVKLNEVAVKGYVNNRRLSNEQGACDGKNFTSII